jgi:hypothetical protein
MVADTGVGSSPAAADMSLFGLSESGQRWQRWRPAGRWRTGEYKPITVGNSLDKAEGGLFLYLLLNKGTELIFDRRSHAATERATYVGEAAQTWRKAADGGREGWLARCTVGLGGG